jgi:NADH-quinone oxidoreductase subunit M
MMHFLFADDHILSTILFTPLVGAIVLFFIPRERGDLHRWIGNIFAMLDLLVSLPLIWRFSVQAGAPRFQFVQDLDWIHSIGARYSLGIDGLSFLMVLLTTVLGAISILSSWSAIRKREKEYYILFLILQTGMLGVFMSLDFVLFYVFWEVMLVPMYFLIGVWGSERRLYAAIKFFLYTLAGSVLMLLAILAIYSTAHTFSIKAILEAPHPMFSLRLERWLFWGFFFAFAIKVPMFPFHTWLPDAHTEAPTAASVILAGVLLKMGAYGFLRFSLPMFPDATNQFRGIMIALSIVAIIYGALVCLMQKDTKRLIAYSSVSHMGFITLGIFALTPLGLSGSIIQQINHGISTGALFLIVGILYERRHTRLISEFGGLSTPMPTFAAVYLIITLSSLGMPLLNGFVGEFTILRGVFDVPVYGWRWATWGVIGVVLGAAYLLWLYQRVMFGNVTNEKNEHLPDLNWRELATLVPLILLAFWIGIYPKPLFRVLDAPVERVVQAVNPSALAQQAQAPAVAFSSADGVRKQLAMVEGRRSRGAAIVVSPARSSPAAGGRSVMPAKRTQMRLKGSGGAIDPAKTASKAFGI